MCYSFLTVKLFIKIQNDATQRAREEKRKLCKKQYDTNTYIVEYRIFLKIFLRYRVSTENVPHQKINF